uniref:Uncharacterized protein n=1 Tax=Glossina brevipalpis TaxID=37001 RepID=A0A1A9WMV4_9MUSC
MFRDLSYKYAIKQLRSIAFNVCLFVCLLVGWLVGWLAFYVVYSKPTKPTLCHMTLTLNCAFGTIGVKLSGSSLGLIKSVDLLVVIYGSLLLQYSLTFNIRDPLSNHFVLFDNGNVTTIIRKDFLAPDGLYWNKHNRRRYIRVLDRNVGSSPVAKSQDISQIEA